MSSYDIGNATQLTATFTDVNGALTDPSTVILYVKNPLGQITEFTSSTIIHVGTGVYTCVVPLLIAGLWVYRWEGSGALVAAADATLNVSPSQFGSL